ncbi:hypothetical protein P280DRAFT_482213 [Massarina eburnea CBS 473.64]|uniref:RING-type domain-containing protein n=1 Tax=Massarina eburnea CBS 473.64 TaxID=1395130 RepID=A0A6A6RTI6_9PLEO|nr:hypothetical protein P280DRAFT_482213 [Massarina eburnea CBS 473.64]
MNPIQPPPSPPTAAPSPKTPNPTDQEIETWIQKLSKTYTLNPPPETLLSTPSTKTISAFQTFTTTILHGLEARDPEFTKYIHNDFLDKTYTRVNLPFHDYQAFHRCIAVVSMMPPRRLSHHVMQILIIAEAMQLPDMTFQQRVDWAEDRLDSWYADTLCIESMSEDPDELWVFRYRNGIRDVTAEQVGAGEMEGADSCPVCADEFEYPCPLDTNSGPLQHAVADAERRPRKSLCGHVVCAACFAKWLEASKGYYKCPICRACLVCGVNGCSYHVIHREVAPPVPIMYTMELVLGWHPRRKEILRRVLLDSPYLFLALRECTRERRAWLGFYFRVLRGGVDRTDVVARMLVGERTRLLDGLAYVFQRALLGLHFLDDGHGWEESGGDEED